MQLEVILKSAVDGDASDVHFKVGLPPVLRVHGHLYPFAACPPLDADVLEQFATTLCPQHLLAGFSAGGEADFAHSFPGVGRFRVHLFRTRGNPGLVLHHIRTVVRSFRELRLPPVLEELAGASAGLVVVAGEAGGGKTTTIAAIIDHVNRRRTCHIVTVEDPIEYVFTDNHSVIDQREVRSDSPSFVTALRATAREDANVIMVSALPDRETIELCLDQAESGRLVLAVSGGSGGHACIARLADRWPPEQRAAALRRLSAITSAVVSIRLVTSDDGTTRLPQIHVERELASEPPPAAEVASRFKEGERWFAPE